MISSRFRVVFLGVITAILMPAVPGYGLDNPALGTVLMPGADVVFSVNLVKMRGTPIIQKMKELGDMKESLGARHPDFDGMKEFTTKMQSITGLEESDFITLTGAAKLDDVDTERGRKPDLSKADAVMAIGLARVLSDDRLETGLKTLAIQTAEERGLQKVPTVTLSNYKGTTVFTGANPDKPEERLLVAMVGDGKLMLIGSEIGVKGAVDRNGGRTESLSSLFPSNIASNVSGRDMFLMFSLTPKMKAKMQSNAEAAAANPAMGMRAMTAQAFAEMTAFGLGMDAGNNLDIHWIGDFGTEPVAQQVKGMIDNTVISAVKMGATVLTGGAPLPMLNTMQATSTPDGTASMSFSIAEQDLTMLKKAAEQRKQQAPGRMMPPPAPEE